MFPLLIKSLIKDILVCHTEIFSIQTAPVVAMVVWQKLLLPWYNFFMVQLLIGYTLC